MPTTTSPTLAELRDAVDVLTRAWAPPPAAPAQDNDQDDIDHDDVNDYDPDDGRGCGCAGGDLDEGIEPYCDCGPLCVCPNCRHHEHAQQKICSMRECHQPTRYKITPWCVHRDGVTRGGDDGDPNIDDIGHVRLGDSLQHHQSMTACGTAHARQLIDADRERRAAYPPDSVLSAEQTYYTVARWDYEPDDVDVPSPINRLPGHLDSAHWWAKEAIKAIYRGDAARRDYDLGGLQRSLTWAVSAYVDHLDEEEPTHA